MKKEKIIVMCLITIILIFSYNLVEAKELQSPIYFGVQEKDEGSSMGYSIDEPTGSFEISSSMKIWNIIQYATSTLASPSKVNVYCLRAGTGFTEGAGDKNPQRYDLEFDMYKEREEIASQDENTSNKILYNLVNGGKYNEILALANIVYLPGESTLEEKDKLLEVSGVKNIWSQFGNIENEEDKQQYYITDDEIEAVQQAAFWYFTNYDEIYNGKKKYNKLDQNNWLYCTTDGRNYISLAEYDPIKNPRYSMTAGVARQRQAEQLYSYLINTAESNAILYEPSNLRPHRNRLILYTSATHRDAQPILKIKKEGKVDLALRQSIVSITNSEEIEKQPINSAGQVAIRDINPIDGSVRKINQSTIQNSKTTAEYYNRKDPLIVNMGDYITYAISIYNEGEKEARATRLQVQLPEGLEFVELENGLFGVANYDKTNNKITLVKLNAKNLQAYDGIKLDYETVWLKCKVTDKRGEKNKVLTTLAWIAEEIDAETGEKITTEIGKDRDSEPATIKALSKSQLVTEDIGYIGNTSNNSKNLSDNNSYFEGQQDDDDFEKVMIPRVEGTYGIQIENKDESDNLITNSNASFSWIISGQTEVRTGTTTNGILNLGPIEIMQQGEETITIKETKVAEGYQELSEDIKIKVNKKLVNDSYIIDAELISNNNTSNISINVTNNLIKIIIKNKEKEFDLALRKYIDNINEVEYMREPQPDLNSISSLGTAEYNHTKQPVTVKKGDEITYTIRIYNEGEIDGYARVITDYLPEGLEFLPEDEINKQYEWVMYDEKENVTEDSKKAVKVMTGYLAKEKETEERQNLIKSFDGQTLNYKEIKIVCKVNENNKLNTKLTNLAEISDVYNQYGYEDRDSTCKNLDIPLGEDLEEYNSEKIENGYDYIPGQEDDDDFEKVIVVERTGSYMVQLQKVDEEGNIITEESEYSWTLPGESKEKNGTTLDGMLNLGTIHITDIDNIDTLEIKEVTVSEDYKNFVGDIVLKIQKGISEKDNSLYVVTNVELAKGEDNGARVKIEENLITVIVPNEKIKRYDLALKNYISKIDEKEIENRIPTISYDKEEKKIVYEQIKEPLEVVEGNIIEYTIRIYNEGNMEEFVEEITDSFGDGLKFLPKNETNIKYEWTMYDEEGRVTDNEEEAVEVKTDYLSKERGMMQEENSNTSEEDINKNLLQSFSTETLIEEGNPDYRDVKIAFEVVELNESDKIIVNSAQISEDSDEEGNPVEDIDSTPDEWNEGEDDQDREYIKLTYFDLALRKWVTEAMVIENGQQTVTQTGHTAEMNPEPIVKVELYRKNLNDVTVKFRYKIRVTNEGDIAGYAKEITEYVPEGLMFVAEDNPEWIDEGKNIVSTRLLENTLLKPEESAEVEVVLTWINGEDNMGQMTNIAEISEDYNDKGVTDRDSTPNNQVEGEDDIDDAPVLLSIETGRAVMYFTLGFTVLGTLAGGLVLIKKFVL